ncbi:unnamed protein product [Urochloa decumbens]|uniref:Uncharacterized protein n=1 Tax=Urochloa decumbens TaxID=240449 RepID=A0ABC9DUB8_9POAL
MAEEPKSPYDPNLKPAAAPATATPRRIRLRRLPVSCVAVLVVIAGNIALYLRRDVRGDDDDDRAAALAFFGFSHLNLVSLFLAIAHFEDSPPGSPARGRARLAVWLLTTTLAAAFTWKIGALLPLGFAVAAWIVAVATVLGGFYMLFLHGDK